MFKYRRVGSPSTFKTASCVGNADAVRARLKCGFKFSKRFPPFTVSVSANRQSSELTKDLKLINDGVPKRRNYKKRFQKLRRCVWKTVAPTLTRFSNVNKNVYKNIFLKEQRTIHVRLIALKLIVSNMYKNGRSNINPYPNHRLRVLWPPGIRDNVFIKMGRRGENQMRYSLSNKSVVLLLPNRKT